MFFTKKVFFTLTLIAFIAVLTTGCGGMGPKPEELIAKQYSISNGIGEKITLSKPEYYIKNDGVYLQNGDIVIDEEGSISYAQMFNGKLYYIVINPEDYHIKLKTQDGELVKDFGVNYGSIQYGFNNKMYIATTSKSDSQIYTNVYSNLYTFDGDKVKLIKKHVIINGAIRVGLDARSWLSSSEQDIYGYEQGRGYSWSFHDIFTAKRKDIKPSLVPKDGYSFLGKKMGYSYKYMVGFVGDVAVYIYKYSYANTSGETVDKTILEAQNLVTGKTIILLDNPNTKFVFLSNGRDVVFKDGNRIIDMRTFRPAVIDDNFKTLTVWYTHANGSKDIYKTYTMEDISYARGLGSNLFKLY